MSTFFLLPKITIRDWSISQVCINHTFTELCRQIVVSSPTPQFFFERDDRRLEPNSPRQKALYDLSPAPTRSISVPHLTRYLFYTAKGPWSSVFSRRTVSIVSGNYRITYLHRSSVESSTSSSSSAAAWSKVCRSNSRSCRSVLTYRGTKASCRWSIIFT